MIRNIYQERRKGALRAGPPPEISKASPAIGRNAGIVFHWPVRTIDNITIRTVSGEFLAPGTLRGNQGDTLRDFTFENIDLKLADPRFEPAGVRNFVAKNVVLNGSTLSGAGCRGMKPHSGACLREGDLPSSGK